MECNLGGNYEEMGVDTCSSIVEIDMYEDNTIPVTHKGESLIFISFVSILLCFSILFVILNWGILCFFFCT